MHICDHTNTEKVAMVQNAPVNNTIRTTTTYTGLRREQQRLISSNNIQCYRERKQWAITMFEDEQQVYSISKILKLPSMAVACNEWWAIMQWSKSWILPIVVVWMMSFYLFFKRYFGGCKKVKGKKLFYAFDHVFEGLQYVLWMLFHRLLVMNRWYWFHDQ